MATGAQVDSATARRYRHDGMTGERQHTQTMQRLRVGLAGLAVVVLLIALASAVMRTVTREAPVTAVGAPKADVVANMVADNTADAAGEPLAEVGVAPVASNQSRSAGRRP